MSLLVISCRPQLKELPVGEEQEEVLEGAAAGGSRDQSLRFGCLLRLSFPRHQQTSTAAAVVEDSFTCAGESSTFDLPALCPRT